ncbi:nucleotidyltransferase family protein [Ideonella azotifigens]|uniref:Nucleotidyltransferase family protein n=1 Tax=Ideonella azotifigens TaxID=513160 RepID=A0ABN1KGT7_9BURK|nr:nucleotidyltransferase family protein [Ideonella azotifigens]MCD2340424.1 nucleotidyltransferase family protein [Ideonella azotifigens]
MTTLLSESEATLALRLQHIVQSSPIFMAALRAVRQVAPPDACIGAGAIRNLVWDHLHGHTEASPVADWDVVFFDAADCRQARDQALQQQLTQACPELTWEVTNQAGVHHWFEAIFGHAVAPLDSLEEAVATWPEYCTSVAIALRPDDSLRIIAPYGLADLFALRVRRNPARVSEQTYRQRVATKQYAKRWPGVTVESC